MSGAEKVLVILNPIAGHGRSGKLMPALTDMLNRSGIEFRLTVTEHAGHAREIVATHDLGDFGIIAAMGGDGTFSEVVDGLLTRFPQGLPPHLKVAAIPSGTGNDFLGGSSLSTDWEGAVRGLEAPVVRRVDVLQVRDAASFRRYAANCFGIGFDALVTSKVTERGTGKIGPLGYMVEAFRGLVSFSPVEVRIERAGDVLGTYRDLWLLGITNSQQYGGGMRINPGARIDDGLFNYAFLHGVPRRNLVGLIFLARSGKHVGREGVVMDVARELSVDAPEGFPCHIDGDTAHVRYPVVVEALPGALPLVVPDVDRAKR